GAAPAPGGPDDRNRHSGTHRTDRRARAGPRARDRLLSRRARPPGGRRSAQPLDRGLRRHVAAARGAEAPEFDHPASVLYFDVQDTDAAYEALRAKGVAFRAAPHAVHREPSRELRMAFFGDGEGNTFAIRAWRPAAGSAA